MNFTPPKKRWRKILRVHPAAEAFPPLGKESLLALAEDIKQHGLRQPVSIIEDGNGNPVLIDGRNRLDALELLGDEINLDNSEIFGWLPASTDIHALVVSLNIHRRHLTSDEKRDLVGKLLGDSPQISDRQIASTVKVDHKTVAKIRSEMEGRGEIPHVEARADTRGRKQPVKKRAREQTTAQVIAPVDPKFMDAKPAKARARSARWITAASAAADALRELQEIQGEYAGWRDNLPDNLQDSAVAEKLDAVSDLDIDGALAIVEEAGALDLPLGFGRD